MLASTTLALFTVALAVLFIVLTDATARGKQLVVTYPADAAIEVLNVADDDPSKPSGKGIGTGSLGRVGFSPGSGEGSHHEPQRAGGGGSGGNKQKLTASTGAIPQASEIAAAIPTIPTPKNPALPVAGIDIDPALWNALPAPVYGDPRSSATIPSNGSGEGGGIGTKHGQGIGDGRGDGFGPGFDGNMGGGRRTLGSGGPGGGFGNNPDGPEAILRVSMVGQRVRVLSKPEPQYTEEARRNQIIGTVVLRAVFSKTGEVANIRAVSSLPFGLTERAIAAARQIRFLPATKDNLPVSVHMQLEYNFNLY